MVPIPNPSVKTNVCEKASKKEEVFALCLHYSEETSISSRPFVPRLFLGVFYSLHDGNSKYLLVMTYGQNGRPGKQNRYAERVKKNENECQCFIISLKVSHFICNKSITI